jgi:hypothetical protein
MAQRTFVFIVAALAIAALLATIAVLRRQPGISKGQNRSSGRDSSALPAATSEPPSAQTEPGSKSVTSTFDRLNAIAARLATSSDREVNRRLLSELRAFLETLPRETVSREVQSYLGAGNDAATQLDLTVKAVGALGDAPSLRVFLLDYLGQIDLPAAAALGRQILRAPTTPDEWAISLRNVARSDDSAATTEYLRAKAAELLANRAWQQNPTAGYLEAFDIVVHTRATETAPQLAELVRNKENKAVAHAAYLTLDRLTIAEPAATLQQFADQPELMAGREQTRANYFARVDVRDPQQRRSWKDTSSTRFALHKSCNLRGHLPERELHDLQ